RSPRQDRRQGHPREQEGGHRREERKQDGRREAETGQDGDGYEAGPRRNPTECPTARHGGVPFDATSWYSVRLRLAGPPSGSASPRFLSRRRKETWRRGS